MVLGDDQYYYISLREELYSICLIMTLDENGVIKGAHLEERRELLKFFHVSLENIVRSLSKMSEEEIKLPIAYVPCPQCENLHFSLDFVSNAKRALRCKTKLPSGYYSDLAGGGT